MRQNVIASYLSQFATVLVSIVMMPLLVKYMGAEAYGLIGLYILLQSCMQLLDMGMTPTLIRESARLRGGVVTKEFFDNLLRSLEVVFVCISIVLVLAAALLSGYIARDWLNVENLPIPDVQYSFFLMVIAIVIRWCSGLHRGIVNGYEQLVWLSVYNTSFAVLRFVVVIFVLIYIDNSPVVFFAHQLVLSVLEIILLKLKSFRLTSDNRTISKIIRFDWSILRSVFKFSITIAVSASSWVVITQADKAILSKLVSLTDYGYFSIAVLAASSIGMLGNTMSVILLPRITKLTVEEKDKTLAVVYKTFTGFVGAISVPLVLLLVFFPEQILYVWTGDRSLAANISVVLSFYAGGYGILVFSSFPYYLQFAKGDLKLHFRGTLLFLFLYLPLLIVLTNNLGIIGAAIAWFSVNALFFIFWVPVLHAKFLPGQHLSWLCNEAIYGYLIGGPIVLLLKYIVPWPSNRYGVAIIVGTIAFLFVVLVSLPMIFVRRKNVLD